MFFRKGKPIEKWGHKAYGPYRKAEGSRVAKGAIKMRKAAVFYLTILTVILLSVYYNTPTSAKELCKTKFDVIIKIPAIQKLEIIEPVQITFTYPESGKASIFTDVGKVRIQSNSDWALAVNAFAGSARESDIDIFIKPSKDKMASWENVDECGLIYNGSYGSQDLSWDIKIHTPLEKSKVPDNEEDIINLCFTLAKL